jgi:hypothetical protein
VRTQLTHFCLLKTDVEVFRRLYEEVGLGWVYAVTKQPWALNLANK